MNECKRSSAYRDLHPSRIPRRTPRPRPPAARNILRPRLPPSDPDQAGRRALKRIEGRGNGARFMIRVRGAARVRVCRTALDQMSVRAHTQTHDPLRQHLRHRAGELRRHQSIAEFTHTAHKATSFKYNSNNFRFKVWYFKAHHKSN